MVIRGGVPPRLSRRANELAATLEKDYPELARALRQSGDSPPPEPNGASDATAPPRRLPGDDPPAPLRAVGRRLAAQHDRNRLVRADGRLSSRRRSPRVSCWRARSSSTSSGSSSPRGCIAPNENTSTSTCRSAWRCSSSARRLAYYFAFDYMLQFLFWFHEKMGIDPYPGSATGSRPSC